MSEQEMDEARKRLTQAKKEMQWLLALLSNPAAFLQELEIDPAEREKLLHEDIAGILEILLPYAEALAEQLENRDTFSIKRTNPRVPQRSAHSLAGRFRFVEARQGNITHIEMVGPGGPVYWPQNPPWPVPDQGSESES